MWATNCTSCELLTVLHMSYEQCFVWDMNWVSCELRTVFHVSYEIWTVFYMSYELCFLWATNFVSYNLDKCQPSKFSLKILVTKSNRKFITENFFFLIVCYPGMWFLSEYTKTWSLRRLTSLSFVVELRDFTNFIFRLQRGPVFNSCCVNKE